MKEPSGHVFDFSASLTEYISSPNKEVQNSESLHFWRENTVHVSSQSDQVALDLLRPFQYIIIDNKLPATISLTLQLTWRRHHLGTFLLPRYNCEGVCDG
ncbi:MAG: hypothetical protein HW389_597 [Bacteroidetes bacterium]|nr:hypothetical protein [Bacteroidota bacterium]